jgi:hypothetical protein
MLAGMELPETVSSGATYAEQEGSKYPEADAYHVSATVEERCGPRLLDLIKDQIHHWKKRYDMYTQERALYRPTMEIRRARLDKAHLANNDDEGVLERWQDVDAILEGER